MRQCLKRSNKSESDTQREKHTHKGHTEREDAHSDTHTTREREAHTYTQ